jgi:serine/threonine-protein kinase HipA
MTSRTAPGEVYVWIWLPGAIAPVVAGLITREGSRHIFNYGRSYLERESAIAIYDSELPLRRGAILPPDNLTLAGCLRDGAPDAWGRRVIINRIFGMKGDAVEVGALDELTYLVESGSDRIGALDFQRSGTTFEPRLGGAVGLDELLDVAERVEKGVPITPELERAVFHGATLGGARPKAAVETEDAKFIAKFSSSADVTNVVKAEFVAMRMADQLGLDVASTKLERAGGKDVLLVRRFDRVKTSGGWARKAMVSALTLLGLDEMMGRYASYQDLAEIIRARFTAPRKTLHELYGRLVFNVLCGNTDDHARNHAAFWDGESLTLTPAYDICPQNRTGREANQAMKIVGERRASTLAACLEAAPQFLLTGKAASEVIETQIAGIREHFVNVSEEASLSAIDQSVLWGRAFLNPYVFEGAPAKLAALERRA